MPKARKPHNESGAKKRTGRPPKSDTIRQRVITLYAKGATLEIAAASCGVSESTVHDWQRNSESFRSQIARARGAKAGDYINRLDTDPDAPHMRWWLSRMYAKDYAPTEKVEYSGAISGQPAVVTSITNVILTDPAVAARFEAELASYARADSDGEPRRLSGGGDSG